MIRRLNHAVLYVHDAAECAEFYAGMLGFRVTQTMGDQAVFMQAPGSDNDHDLALFGIGRGAESSEAGRRTVGLYHLAWEVDTLADLAAIRDKLSAAGALAGASNHGVSRSLYAKDPSGLEFEVMWEVPAELIDPDLDILGVTALDLDADIARFGLETTRNR